GEDAERRRPVMRLDQAIAQSRHEPAHQLTDRRLVLDQKNGLAIPDRLGRAGRLRDSRLLASVLRPWQQEPHAGATAEHAVDADPAARLLDEAVDYAEAETAALAERLGREEGLEGAREHLGGHTGS